MPIRTRLSICHAMVYYCGDSLIFSNTVAMQIAEKAQPGSVILCMLPDTGERYLSSPLFAEIPETMSDDEMALSKSTPGFQMP